MSVLGTARYRLLVDGVGRALLGWERRRSERAMARPDLWDHPHLAPPLGTSPRLKELISRHYLAGRHAPGGRKVAWVTSGAPVEPFVALGFYTLYPENHGAMCGIRRDAEGLSVAAEEAGWSRDVCSYARTDLGSVLTGRTPVGRLPPPDLLVCSTNICQTVLLWYQVLAHHFRVPLVVIDTPFVYDTASEDDVAFVARQLEAGIGVAERVAGRTLSPKALEAVTRRAKEAMGLWGEVMDRGRHRPSPLTAFDEFIHMAPIVEMRSEPTTLDYYRALLAELDERVARGVGAVRGERVRLLWDNLPIWPRMRWLGDRLAARGAALVGATYTNAWAELAHLVDPERPLESAARTYLHPILNRGTGAKLATMREMAGRLQADGVILHSDRSCKPYSIGQMDQRDQLTRSLELPALLLEADHNDPRAFADEQVAGRLDAFLEVLEA